MTYLITHFWPGATEAQYRATIAVVHPPGGLPAGQTYHAAGPTDGGFLITAVWDSKASADDFVARDAPGQPADRGRLRGRARGARRRGVEPADGLTARPRGRRRPSRSGRPEG